MAYNFYIRVIIVSSFANLVKIIVLIHSFVKIDFTYAIMFMNNIFIPRIYNTRRCILRYIDYMISREEINTNHRFDR